MQFDGHISRKSVFYLRRNGKIPLLKQIDSRSCAFKSVGKKAEEIKYFNHERQIYARSNKDINSKMNLKKPEIQQRRSVAIEFQPHEYQLPRIHLVVY